MPQKYKHMLPREEVIWDAYIARHGLPEGLVDYDVHLGEGAPLDESWPAWMKSMVKSLSTHRLDVVVIRPLEVVIVEIKSVAGMSAVGQLLGYEALWLQEYGTEKPVTLVCVCERAESDMQTVFQFYEVTLIELGELPRE